MIVREDILQHIWQFKLFATDNLQTLSGKKIQIQHPGSYNPNQGPDFFQAKINIDNTLWAGNVEIHIRTSDWYKHQHHKDKNYQNIILHIVYEHDTEWNENIELLELKPYIPEQYIRNINHLFHTGLTYCLPHWKHIDSIHINQTIIQAAFEKLAHKKEDILQLLASLNNDWDETFYVYLARYFGLKVNNEPFQRLARQTPLKILEKHADSIFQLEALLFGQSGLLYRYPHSLYAQKLLKEYELLKLKYGLHGLDAENWKFSKMRPTAFPTVKIAQFAALIKQHSRLFQTVLHAEKLSVLRKIFTPQPSEYWQTHYTFGNESKPSGKKLSAATVDLLLINVVLPFAFTYAQHTGQEDKKEKIIALFEELPPEKNKLINEITPHFSFDNALQTQGMLFLKDHYCLAKQCLHCSIGNKIIQHK